MPNCHVYIYYMDIRTFGLYETKYYWQSQEEFKVKYIKARIAEVTSDGKKLIVKGEDTLVKRPITIPFAWITVPAPMNPIPVITPAAIRVMSLLLDSSPCKISWEKIIIMVAPKQIKIFVRNPAGF